MKRMIAWFATNPVAANLLMGFAVIAGLAALVQIPVKMYPDVEVPIISVTVPYLGAAPEEVETGVCARVEERLEGITGIKELNSIAREGLCTTNVELFFDADNARVLDEVQNQVNAIDTFPEETEKPIVRFLELTTIVVEVAVTGPTDERALKELGQRVRNDILALPGITHADLANVRPYEISVEVSQESLLRNGLTFDEVAAAVRKRSIDLPGGSIKTRSDEVLLRARGQAYWGPELERLVVTTRADGTRVYLSEVARVVDGFEDTGQTLSFDGKPAALIQVARVGNQDLRHISETVRQFVGQSASRYPEGVELTVWNDESVLVSDRLSTLVDSGFQGLLLVLILLALFLRPHLAIWVAAGIPIAFLGAIFLIYWFGYSIDAISVIGFILALGMLVDDAVVVGEGVYVAHRRGAGQLAGAIEGAQNVLVPVTFGVLTTMAAFTPLLFSVGAVGELMAIIAATVIFCLVFSMIECQMVLPAHLGHSGQRMPLGEFGMTLLVTLVVAAIAFAPDRRSAFALALGAVTLVYAGHLSGLLANLGVRFTRAQLKFESGLESFIDTRFRNLVRRVLDARRLTLALALAALASAAGIVAGGHLPFSFMMPVLGDRVAAKLTMPPGIGAVVTDRAIAQLSTSARSVQRQLADESGDSPVLHIMVARGGHPSTGAAVSGQQASGTHLGEVVMQLSPSESRELTTEQIADIWREANGPIDEAIELNFDTERVQTRRDIDIRLTAEDLDALRTVAAGIRAGLAEYPGVYEITDSFRAGKEELQLSVSPAGEALGITLSDLARQVRQAFYGEEAQRVQRGREDVRIMVRFTEQERQSLESLYALRIRTADGGAVPFRTVAEVQTGRGLATITRTGGARSVNVTAKIDPTRTSAGAVLAELDAGFLPDTVSAYPGMTYSLETAQQQREVAERLVPMFLLALFAIFALLAIPLQSYQQPLIIMATLPFAFMGAVWGHLLMKGYGNVLGLSMPSIFGVVAACGVVINATLVLLHEVNRRLSAGDSPYDALVNAAVTRARPILITTVTTFAGLLPLMLTRSVQAQPLIPMAASLAYGVLFSSAATLLVAPAFLLMLRDLTGGARRGAQRVGDLLGDLAGTAPRLQRWMEQFPYVQESLRAREFEDLQIPDDIGLDPETARAARQGLVRLYYEREFDREEMRAQLGAIAAKAPATDNLVGEARVWAEQQSFQLGVHMLRGVIAPVDAARPLTDILDSCLNELLQAARQDLLAELDQPLGGNACLVALDSAGRREFAIGSPLRLMFVYEPSSGRSTSLSLAPEAAYGQYLQRLMRLVHHLSPEGMLFEAVPPYALPQGSGTAAACPLSALSDHFDDAPAPSELRLLTHARVIEAQGELGERFAAFRQAALSRTPNRDALVADLVAARRGIAQRHRPGDIWDVRGRLGGLGDLELLAEYLQLTGAATTPAVLVNGLAPTFTAAAEHGLIDQSAAADLAAAASLWQCLDGYFRMTSPGDFDPESTSEEVREVIAQGSGVDAFDALPTRMADAAQRVAELFDRLLDGQEIAAR
ncbi:MAG: hypothetical protein F4X81_00840 [Gammaproteobacteria bacterium]|nr:hypothetical protein [Gammaproteobacteria bacterium]